MLEALVPAVLEQKVVGKEAWRAWRLLLRAFGEPAPGPAPARMRVPPGPLTWASIPSWEWHKAGVEAVRARTIAAAAKVAGRLEEIVDLPPEQADKRLRSIPGVGVWTSAEVRQRACGDPDAISVGDYHLPSIVGMALIGKPVDDAGMLELLAPYAGHRHRASVLAWYSGAGRSGAGRARDQGLPCVLTWSPLAGGRLRARELGIDLGPGPTGPHNAITDVAGVRVGHVS